MGVTPNNGIGDVYSKIKSLPEAKQTEIKNDIMKQYESRPELAYVNSRNGITNLHVPSDVIIDASMPPMIRDSGKMWDKNDQQKDTYAMVPDRSYAGIYKEIVNYCRETGGFDVRTMGAVSNVGLMAKKAEEYGSHDKTFVVKQGKVRVTFNNKTLYEQNVENNDIFRMCQTKNEAIKDWVKLAVDRLNKSGHTAVFWLDENRAHDKNLINLVNNELKSHKYDTNKVKIMNPVKAMRYSCEQIHKGESVISVTGNVLRD